MTEPDIKTLLRDSLQQIRDLKAKLQAAEARNEPVAIVGIGCRFPGGADSPEAFWDLLAQGTDAIREIPAERTVLRRHIDADPRTPGRFHVTSGGFLEGVDRFEPQFFGISPREAATIDPQQRLLLETTWEALEHAAIAPSSLAGSRTGVFVGIGFNDYAELQSRFGENAETEIYGGPGKALSIASNRLSYVLGLQGPSLSIDTACSSSLVALHLAVESLRAGQSDLALAGGVNLILSPDNTVFFAKAGMLAADGRCKTFDASADGYVRSEGCGMVVLRRLSDAERAGDPILAIIRGSAVNQNGRGAGLTAPSAPAQASLIREALAAARVPPSLVSYVEAHGTGTSLGDPIEVEGLTAALGGPREAPLAVGSVKTNIGHLEMAAGIAGVIKVVLALQQRCIPPHLHLNTVNPYVHLDAIPAVVPRTLLPWTAIEGRRIAGVSSFGFGGTNAHVILEEYTRAVAEAELESRPVHVLPLSARSDGALRELASAYASMMDAQGDVRLACVPPGFKPGGGGRDARPPALADVCFTASTGRSHLGERMAVVAGSLDEARNALRSAGSEDDLTLCGAVPPAGAPRLAFLFTGQGSQFRGMGQELFRGEPVFRNALERCDELLRASLPAPLLDVLFSADENDARIHDTRFTQPALFAFEYALAELWRSWGIVPNAVLGHSVGEYVAACIAGVFSLEDALRLVAERGRLMAALPERGAMIAVTAELDEVRALIEPHARRVALAAINGHDESVVSGAEADVRAIADELRRRGRRVTELSTSQAFHSPLLDPMLEPLTEAARAIACATPRIPVVSNLYGRAVLDELRAPSYWSEHARGTVRFHEGLQSLVDGGIRLFLEIGPRPVLAGLGSRAFADATWLSSFRRGRGELEQIAEALAELYVRGVDPDWPSFHRGRPGARIVLPRVQWQRQRCWFATGGDEETIAMPDPVHTRATSPERATLRRTLDEAPEWDREQLVIDYVRTSIRRLLHLPASAAIDREQRLADFGVDSLIGLQLRNRLEAALDLAPKTLPATLVFDQPTPAAIARFVLARVFGEEPSAAIAPAPAPPPPDSLRNDIAMLSEAEAEALLLRKLEGLTV